MLCGAGTLARESSRGCGAGAPARESSRGCGAGALARESLTGCGPSRPREFDRVWRGRPRPRGLDRVWRPRPREPCFSTVAAGRRSKSDALKLVILALERSEAEGSMHLRRCATTRTPRGGPAFRVLCGGWGNRRQMWGQTERLPALIGSEHWGTSRLSPVLAATSRPGGT